LDLILLAVEKNPSTEVLGNFLWLYNTDEDDNKGDNTGKTPGFSKFVSSRTAGSHHLQLARCGKNAAEW
jgi:hypothetical protein